jgi:hypothetical protein
MTIPRGGSDDIVELLGLDDGAREPVEDEPRLRVGLCQTIVDDADHQVVRDEPA